MRTNETNIIGSENCLYLNIHTTAHIPPPLPTLFKENQDDTTSFEHEPTTYAAGGNISIQHNIGKIRPLLYPSVVQHASRQLPVLVWLHGGSYQFGSGGDPSGTDYLVAKDVVVVTLNYRLGALGFLSIPSADINGNYGLLDQQMALVWIRRHIHSFGGDPNKITLIGWSAGSSSVASHLFAESSAGLFHQAIMMSGSFINPWAFSSAKDKTAQSILTHLNITDVNDSHLKSILQGIDANLFVRNVTNQILFEYFGHTQYGFVPTLDCDVSPKTPDVLLSSGKIVNAVPLLIGATSIESTSDYAKGFKWTDVDLPNKDTELLSKLDAYLELQLKTPFEDVKREMRRMEFLSKFYGLVDEIYGIWKFALDYGSRSRKRTFLYRFSFDGKFNYFKQSMGLNTPGAVHGDDLGYLFGIYKQQDLDPRNCTDESLVRARYVDMWTTFAKFGDPTPQRSRKPLPIKWPSLSRENKKVLDINLTMSLLSLDELMNNCAYRLWDAIYRCLYRFDCSPLNNQFLSANLPLIE